jgi:hypothetical protein
MQAAAALFQKKQRTKRFTFSSDTALKAKAAKLSPPFSFRLSVLLNQFPLGFEI